MLRGVGEVSDARGTRKCLILGLDAENVRRLTGGQPVVVECGDVNLPPLQVQLIYGETPAALLELLKPMMGDRPPQRRLILPPDKLS